MMLSAAQGGRMPPPKPKSMEGASPAAAVVSLADFHSAASAISSEIYTTSQKLQELSTLVRDSSRSLFNDPSEKITVYVHDISEDIRRLKGKLESAQQYVQSKKDARGAKTQVTEHSEMVVKGLKTGFDTAAKSFRGVVKQRAENVKAQQARKKEFGQPSGSTSKASKLQLGRPKVYGKSPGGNSALPRPDGTLAVRESWNESGAGSGGGAEGGGYYGGGGGGGALVKRSPGRGGGMIGQAVQTPLIPDTKYFESRAEAVSEIEAHIMELGTVFNRLGELVQDQQELTERLHENVSPK